MYFDSNFYVTVRASKVYKYFAFLNNDVNKSGKKRQEADFKTNTAEKWLWESY